MYVQIMFVYVHAHNKVYYTGACTCTYKLMHVHVCTHMYVVEVSAHSPTEGYFASCSKDRCARMWSYDRVYPIRSLAGHTADVDVSVSV